VREDGDIIVIVPVKRAADGRRVTGLPKGHLEAGESAEQAAEREVAEETGVRAELVGELGDVNYHYERRGRTVAKTVRFFEFRYLSGDVADHDHEIEEARWLAPGQAIDVLTYPGEREVVARLLSRRGEDR
jgi:8-oxo-dGTP pyrophosphatase MutT (NUDIX family)